MLSCKQSVGIAQVKAKLFWIQGTSCAKKPRDGERELIGTETYKSFSVAETQSVRWAISKNEAMGELRFDHKRSVYHDEELIVFYNQRRLIKGLEAEKYKTR